MTHGELILKLETKGVRVGGIASTGHRLRGVKIYLRE